MHWMRGLYHSVRGGHCRWLCVAPPLSGAHMKPVPRVVELRRLAAYAGGACFQRFAGLPTWPARRLSGPRKRCPVSPVLERGMGRP